MPIDTGVAGGEVGQPKSPGGLASPPGRKKSRGFTIAAAEFQATEVVAAATESEVVLRNVL